MHISRIHIRNIRSIDDFEIKLGEDERPGWHVILGDNGAGKSSVIRSIALAAVGPSDSQALRQNWSNWLQYGRPTGEIDVDFVADTLDVSTIVKAGQSIPTQIQFELSSDATAALAPQSSGSRMVSPPTFSKDAINSQSIWGTNSGWFSASFGPFRRFSGGEKGFELLSSYPKAAAHLSAFGEDVALTEALRWLKELHIRSLEKSGIDTQLKDAIVEFVNGTGFLPHDAKIDEINSERVSLRDGDGHVVSIDQMSDGYRSILSLTFELLRQMVIQFGPTIVLANIDSSAGTINLPGVIAIDEIDAHLHPAWQKRIGEWFVTRFPRVQFFVTTHSPIICQAAVKGSIWRLPTPGTLQETSRVTGDDLNRLIYGSILDAFGTQFFGIGVTRSEVSKEKLVELARLNRKSLSGQLPIQEQDKLSELRATFPSTAANVADEKI
jgi:hypothetical protein